MEPLPIQNQNVVVLFWALIFLIGYCYFLYPFFLFLIARIKPYPVRKSPYQPFISVIIAVCDEEDVIEAKIKNLLSLDYPADKLEIMIGSDGSTDKTNEIVREFKEGRIRLYENTARQGKVAMLSRMIPDAKGEVFLFTDARQILDRSAARELVENFADEKIGCVSGELMFAKAQEATGKGVNLYWNYEKFIRSQESRIHSMLGATGAIYAIRRELYVSPPENTVLDDMYIPLKIIERGYRAIFDGQAKAYDAVAANPQEEHRRKARTLYGNYQIFGLFPGMFIPFKSPIALQFFSHKFLRVTVPFLLIAVFILNALLVQDLLYGVLFKLQIVFYGMAVIGALARNKKYGILRAVSLLCYIPYVFCLLNFSALSGFFRFLAGKQNVAWQKARKK